MRSATTEGNLMTNVDWNRAAELGQLRAVIDPGDTEGGKNLLIDRIHWNHLRFNRGAKRVLDFGCGTGRFARRLANCGLQYVGIDSSPNMVATARRLNAGSDLSFVAFDGQSIPARSDWFDLCVSVGVFQYLIHGSTAKSVVREVRRVMQRGGRFSLIEQATRSGRSSGTVERGASEQDYISLLSTCFQVESVSPIRSCRFSRPIRRFLGMRKTGPLASPIFLQAAAKWEASWLSLRGNRYFDGLDYFDILIEARAV
jgi:SAM-dependent methyltransferase